MNDYSYNDHVCPIGFYKIYIEPLNRPLSYMVHERCLLSPICAGSSKPWLMAMRIGKTSWEESQLRALLNSLDSCLHLEFEEP